MSLSITLNKLVAGKHPYTIPVVADNILNLSTNENLLNHPFTNNLNVNKYPNTIDNDYTALIQLLSQYVSTNVTSILLTAGSGAGLKLILQTFTNDDTEILIPTPNYPGFMQDANLASKNITTVNVFNQNGFNNDSVFMKAIDGMSNSGSGVVYISSPNMPFGYTISEEFISTIINNPKLLFIVDQAYAEYDSTQSIDLFTKLTDTCKNVIVVKTLSKAFAAAGIRIGYLVANSELINYLRIHYCTKSVNYSSYKTARLIIETEIESHYYTKRAVNDLDEMGKKISIIKSMCDYTKQVKDVIFSNKAPFFILRVSDAAYVCNIFKRNLLLVRDKTADIRSSDMSFIDDSYVRISMGSNEVMDRIINIISKLNFIKPYMFDTIFLDLDITLRKNYHSRISEQLQIAIAEVNKHCNVNIITDNKNNTNTIIEYLRDNNIQYNQLYTPYNDSIILSPTDISNGYKILEDSVLIIKYPIVTLELMNSINRYKHIKIIEDSYYESSLEICNDNEDDIKIPFIGAFLETINKCDYHYHLTVIGKGKLKLETTLNTIHIGDSDNDYNFAFTNGIYFKKVNNPLDTLEFLQSGVYDYEYLV